MVNINVHHSLLRTRPSDPRCNMLKTLKIRTKYRWQEIVSGTYSISENVNFINVFRDVNSTLYGRFNTETEILLKVVNVFYNVKLKLFMVTNIHARKRTRKSKLGKNREEDGRFEGHKKFISNRLHNVLNILRKIYMY